MKIPCNPKQSILIANRNVLSLIFTLRTTLHYPPLPHELPSLIAESKTETKEGRNPSKNYSFNQIHQRYLEVKTNVKTLSTNLFIKLRFANLSQEVFDGWESDGRRLREQGDLPRLVEPVPELQSSQLRKHTLNTMRGKKWNREHTINVTVRGELPKPRTMD